MSEDLALGHDGLGLGWFGVQVLFAHDLVGGGVLA